MGRQNDGGLANNASAPSYDPVSGNYRPANASEMAAGQSQGSNPFLRLLKGGLGGLGQGLQNQQSQNRNFYGY